MAALYGVEAELKAGDLPPIVRSRNREINGSTTVSQQHCELADQ